MKAIVCFVGSGMEKSIDSGIRQVLDLNQILVFYLCYPGGSLLIYLRFNFPFYEISRSPTL